MADIYSHTKLAKRVINEIDYDFNKELVFMGAQGPDPLCYIVLGKDSKDYSYFCSRTHDTNTQMLLINMVHYVKQHLTKETYSYLIGFLTHYALDVSIHPYIYYNVGEYKKNKPETDIYKGLHLQFERSVDCVIIEEDTKKKAHKLKLHKTQFLTGHMPQEVADIMGYTLKQTYGKDNGAFMFKRSVKTMYKNVKHMLYDPFGIKKQFYKIADLFLKQDLFIKDVSMFNHIKNYDYLNLEHKTWHHPVTNEAFTKSVYDLVEEGYTFAKDITSKVHRYIFDNAKMDLETVFTNLSFNSGVDCNHHNAMQHFKAYNIK